MKWTQTTPGPEIMVVFLFLSMALRRFTDFVFNGWGMKFARIEDNLITGRLFMWDHLPNEFYLLNMQPFVLEEVASKSDGKGTLLTTAECLLSLNRNEYCMQGKRWKIN